VRRLEVAAPTLTGPLPASYDRLRDDAMHSLGIGTTRDMKSVVTGVFIPSWQFQGYTVSEKIALWRGKAFSMKLLRDKVFATDLTQQVTALDLPVYFWSGVYDYTVNYSLTRDYFEKLQTPLKGFYTFEQSAHSPMFEEPGKAQRILREDVLAGENRLADSK
jgi:pimeloyl-ACP methyl ester carboxylesterase